MKPAVEAEKSIVPCPPFQLWQLLHRTFATILPPLTPEPSRRVICAVVSYWGSDRLVAYLGDTVTLLPSEEVYMTKMLAPTMPLPCPSAAHE